MESQDIEQVLKSTKFRHLPAETLLSYRDKELSEIELARADAHLRLCLICEKELDFLKEEQAALQNYEVTANDRALIRRVIDGREAKKKVFASNGVAAAPMERLAVWLNELTTAWVAFFSRVAMRGSGDGTEVFRFETTGLMIWGELETDASLTIHFSSPDPIFTGAKIRFRLGPFTEVVTLQPDGDNGVTAKIRIPRAQRARRMNDVSVEAISEQSGEEDIS